MFPRIYRSEADNRKHQINTLKVFNDNVSEVVEGSEYQVSFKAGDNEFTLSVTLTNNFPKDKPIIKISPCVVHPWVNSEGEVTGAPGLLNFTIHSDLGRVVQAIIRELERNPPPLANDYAAVNNVASNPSNIVTDDLVSPNFSTNFSGMRRPSPPSHMSAASEIFSLSKLSLEELQFINENDDRLQEMVDELPQIKEQNRMLDELIDKVEELADSNLSKQTYLEELKSNIDKQLEEVAKLAFENEQLHNNYLSLSQKYAPRNIQEKLRLASQEADAESEKIAESFLNGEIDVDNFVSVYTKARTLCQTRKTKEEKLSQQLDKLERAGY